MRRRIMTSSGYAMLLSAAMAAGLSPRPADAQSITQKASVMSLPSSPKAIR